MQRTPRRCSTSSSSTRTIRSGNWRRWVSLRAAKDQEQAPRPWLDQATRGHPRSLHTLITLVLLVMRVQDWVAQPRLEKPLLIAHRSNDKILHRQGSTVWISTVRQCRLALLLREQPNSSMDRMPSTPTRYPRHRKMVKCVPASVVYLQDRCRPLALRLPGPSSRLTAPHRQHHPA